MDSQPQVESAPSVIPIPSETLVRGTTSATILGGFGLRLRETVGGIGCAAVDGEEEYARSVQVQELDVFLSHSWHAVWWKKYLMLLLEWNVKPATWASVTAGILCSLMCPLGLPYFADGQACGAFGDKLVSLTICATGMCVFLITLLMWHHISNWLGLGSMFVFFDKVCIHQTDPVQKERGIRAIGGILERSKLMLVAWDPSYLSRLWCVHELSAFKKAHPDREVLIRTASLSTFVSSVAVLSLTMYAFTHARWSGRSDERRFWVTLVIAMLAFVSMLVSLRHYSNERRSLKTCLASFSVRQSLCFCCTHNHVHPDTRQPLMCDRELVYDYIAMWYGDGDREAGLDEFDHMIRGALKEDLHRSLGKSWNIPYAYTLTIGLLPFFLRLGRGCYSCDEDVQPRADDLFYHWFGNAVSALELLLLRFPICAVFALLVCNYSAAWNASKALDRFVDIAVSGVCAVVVYAMSGVDGLCVTERCQCTLYVVEILTVVLFYVILAKMHVHRRMEVAKQTTMEMGRTLSSQVSRLSDRPVPVLGPGAARLGMFRTPSKERQGSISRSGARLDPTMQMGRVPSQPMRGNPSSMTSVGSLRFSVLEDGS